MTLTVRDQLAYIRKNINKLINFVEITTAIRHNFMGMVKEKYCMVADV